MMRTKIFRQYDDHWRWLPYPGHGYYINGAGCGCVAVTHVVIERTKYKDYTPANVQPYMRPYATYGDGTRRAGITAALNHYGLENVHYYDESVPIRKAFKELDKGGRIGIIVFGSTKGPDGTVWTTGGHYIAFTAYKKTKKGRHRFYLKDSGYRQHDGWYTYEKSMRGDVKAVYTCTVPDQYKEPEIKASTYKPTKPYSGNLPTKTVKEGASGAQVTRLQRFLNWAINAKLSADGSAGPKTADAVRKYQKTYGLAVDGVFGPASLKKAKALVKKYAEPDPPESWQDKALKWALRVADMKNSGYRLWNGKDKSTQVCLLCHPEADPKHKWNRYTWNCIGFVFACLFHGGGVPCKCSCGVIDNGYCTRLLKMSDKEALKTWKEHTGCGPWEIIRNGGKRIPESRLKTADVCLVYSKGRYVHTAMKAGKGKVIDCARRKKNIRTADYDKYNVLIAFRYVGKVR